MSKLIWASQNGAIFKNGEIFAEVARWHKDRKAMCDEIVTACNAYEQNQATIKALTESLTVCAIDLRIEIEARYCMGTDRGILPDDVQRMANDLEPVERAEKLLKKAGAE